jgi:hypothetical protein
MHADSARHRALGLVIHLGLLFWFRRIFIRFGRNLRHASDQVKLPLMIAAIRLSDDGGHAAAASLSLAPAASSGSQPSFDAPAPICFPYAGKLDRNTQISGLRKLKLTNCALAVAWVEHLREIHGLGVSNEAQPVGYGAIDPVRRSDVVRRLTHPTRSVPDAWFERRSRPDSLIRDCIINSPGVLWSGCYASCEWLAVSPVRHFGRTNPDFMNENNGATNHLCRNGDFLSKATSRAPRLTGCGRMPERCTIE